MPGQVCPAGLPVPVRWAEPGAAGAGINRPHRGLARAHVAGVLAPPLLRTVFNYPTLAECYKVAALDASNTLRY